MGAEKSVLLIISGGVAAYKALELARLLVKSGVKVHPLLTKGGAQFVTPLALASITGQKLHQFLFSLTDEQEIGHIHLARMCDLIIIAPATAHIMAKMAHGLADDLASTVLLASDKPILIAPAMNPFMWENPATKANLALLKARGVHFSGPDRGDMACGEHGEGRLLAPEAIFTAIMDLLSDHIKPLAGKKILVSAGATHEPIDDIRYIANHSSGKQGYAIAETLADAGAEVTLLSGITALPTPKAVKRIQIKTAQEMYDAAHDYLIKQGEKIDIAIMAAAIGDWRLAQKQAGKIKKQAGQSLLSLDLVENPDILKSIAQHKSLRPKLVIGFAAEAENALEAAKVKYQAKGCDWILLNDVGTNPEIFGGDENKITMIRNDQVIAWPMQSKHAVAKAVLNEIINDNAEE